jgi:hypothetical protein
MWRAALPGILRPAATARAPRLAAPAWRRGKVTGTASDEQLTMIVEQLLRTVRRRPLPTSTPPAAAARARVVHGTQGGMVWRDQLRGAALSPSRQVGTTQDVDQFISFYKNADQQHTAVIKVSLPHYVASHGPRAALKMPPRP